MERISIENLGPIDGKFEMSLDQKLTILIGEQATGKSTIAKALYFCYFCISATIDAFKGKNSIVFGDYLREDMRLYFYKNYNHGSVKYTCNELGTDLFINFGSNSPDMKITNVVDLEYRNSLYIPAGRSIIPLLFENYAAASRIKVDPFFDEFLLFLDAIRKEYNISLHEMLAQALDISPYPIDENNVKGAILLVNQILKSEYRYQNGREQLFFNSETSMPIVSASSGQQEVLYILMTLFYALLHPKPYTIIIEEPEAHIFPMAQKLIIELVVRVINATGSHVIITTHSPYILTATNLLIHSAIVENKINSKETVVDPMARLNPEDVSAYMLERNGSFSYRSIIDGETGLIAAEEIDTVSEIIDEGMSDLINLEVKYGL